MQSGERRRKPFVVTRESPKICQPRKGTFDRPGRGRSTTPRLASVSLMTSHLIPCASAEIALTLSGQS